MAHVLRCFLAVFTCLTALQAQFFNSVEPKTRSATKVFRYETYVVGWSDKTHTPLWSAIEVKDAGEPTTGCTRLTHFASDPAESPAITHTDYAAADEEGVKYSRGHMTPNSIMAYTFGCEAAATTFKTSNIVPQLQNHNAGIWEALESAIGGKSKGKSGFTKGLAQNVSQVFVYTGPVFWGRSTEIKKISSKEIWVPTALWKTVIWKDGEGQVKTCSWMIPHENGLKKSAYMEYVVTIRDIHRKTGVNILPSIQDSLYTQSDPDEFLETADK
jgi:DNA/RNA endonuclease G (NUC1)